MRLTVVLHQSVHPVVAAQAAVAVPEVQVQQEVQVVVPVEPQQLPQEARHKPLPVR